MPKATFWTRCSVLNRSDNKLIALPLLPLHRVSPSINLDLFWLINSEIEPRQQVVDEDIEFNRQVRDVRRKSIGELLPRARLEDAQPTVDVVTPAKGNFDSFIKNFASPITSRKPSAGYQDVDLWQLELENEQYRRKQDYVSKQLQSLRELSEKYRNSEVKIDEQVRTPYYVMTKKKILTSILVLEANSTGQRRRTKERVGKESTS